MKSYYRENVQTLLESSRSPISFFKQLKPKSQSDTSFQSLFTTSTPTMLDIHYQNKHTIITPLIRNYYIVELGELFSRIQIFLCNDQNHCNHKIVQDLAHTLKPIKERTEIAHCLHSAYLPCALSYIRLQ
jgi:hypothetical protein